MYAFFLTDFLMTNKTPSDTTQDVHHLCDAKRIISWWGNLKIRLVHCHSESTSRNGTVITGPIWIIASIFWRLKIVGKPANGECLVHLDWGWGCDLVQYWGLNIHITNCNSGWSIFQSGLMWCVFFWRGGGAISNSGTFWNLGPCHFCWLTSTLVCAVKSDLLWVGNGHGQMNSYHKIKILWKDSLTLFIKTKTTQPNQWKVW